MRVIEGGFSDGDVAALICPLCGKPVHITEFGPEGEPLPDPQGEILDEYIAAHWAVFHPYRTRLLRWLSKGWFP